MILMKEWEHSFFNADWLDFIKTHYKKLLAVGKSDDCAEDMIVSYVYEQMKVSGIDEGRFWLALALMEWKLGRLSPRTKAKANYWISQMVGHIDRDSLRMLVQTLESPILNRVRIARPRVRHCPWKEGSLLAYRIQSNPRLSQTPFWNKYVLLRVVKIIRWPITELAPDDCYDESMLVGLYQWVGDTIPKVSEVSNLKFTPISIEKPSLRINNSNQELLKTLSGTFNQQMDDVISKITKERIETCFSLSWDKESRRNGTITLLDYSPFVSMDMDFFATSITEFSMGGVLAFDNILCKRLRSLY